MGGRGKGNPSRVSSDRMAAQRAVPVSDKGALRASTAEMRGLPSPKKAPCPKRLLQTQKAANVFTLAAFVGRTPGSGCYRCFLSNLTGLAVLPPSGLKAS